MCVDIHTILVCPVFQNNPLVKSGLTRHRFWVQTLYEMPKANDANIQSQCDVILPKKHNANP